MGLGFTLGLTCIGIVREFLGSGAFFGMSFVPADYNISIFVLAPGAVSYTHLDVYKRQTG